MRLTPRFPLVLLAALALCLPAVHPAAAQCVSLTTLGSASTQDFNTLATAGTGNAWTDNSTLPGWYSTRTTYNAGTGSSNTGALYSFGVAGVNPLTDRALGGVASGGTGTFYWAVCFVNNTGSALTSLDISYMGEQWRDGLPVPAAAQSITFEYQVAAPAVITDADTPTTGWTAFSSMDFTSPQTGTAAGALDGNQAANRTLKSANLVVTVAPGNEVWLRWRDINDASNDHGLAIDDFSVTPQAAATPVLNISDVTLAEGDPPGTTTFTFDVTLTAPTGGGVTFDIATADGTAEDGNPATEDEDYVAQSLTGQSIPGGSTGPYQFSVTVNRDLVAEPNETFFVNVTNIVGADPGDTQGLGTINNDDVAVVFIHDVQGSGAATPIPGATVTVEGVVIGNFQGTDRLRGFFLQEEDADANAEADPSTSEGIFIFCSTCPTAVAEGQRVRVTGTVSEFNNMTQITASTAGSVVVTDAGNNLDEVTPATIDLPVVGVIDDFYETLEGMLVTFVDTLTVSEYFEMARFGHLELFEGGRPRQFTEMSAPSVPGYAAHLDNLDRRRVILDDDDNAQNAPLLLPNGSQFVFHPQANGGFSAGTQGTDFFRGGDLVNGLTGVLHWSFPGTGANTWRIRPTAATPATFTVANPRPATPPAVGGAIKAVSMNLLNYFTTIDTTSSSSSGPCGPSMTQDCRGADSTAELNRQRERAAVVICGLNADVLGLIELENTTATDTITDLLGAVNALCGGGANDYDFVDTGGTLGTDAIRVELIYRSGTLSPVGSPHVDLDPIHNRPPTAQTFDVVDPLNPAFGERFTVIANHFKSKGCDAGAVGPDADAGDGQACYNGRRVSQSTRLLTWINSTVVPAAGDPDVLLLGDFNSYAEEDPITTLEAGGYTDLESALLGPNAYSYLFDGQLGHLDYAFTSASLTPEVSGIGAWHINADEVPLFDYNDEVHDSPGEASFEEKPDGSALVPPRVVFEPASPYRAADHDPVLVGLFPPGDDYFTVTPCRVVDTRSGSPLQNGVPQTFAVKGECGIPATAKTVVFNITVVTPTGDGDLTIYASDATPPAFATMPFHASITRALISIVSLSNDVDGEVTVQASVAGNGTVHVLLDVMGYFE